MSGIFYFVANAIGNPSDISLRAIELLKSCDILCFEEDRGARVALKQAGLHREYLKFTEHREEATLAILKDALGKNLTILYMSDQGAPNIADPGYELILLANSCSAKIKIIPGPSSVTAALMACSFDTQQFYFAGFLPREKNNRETELKNITGVISCPIVLLETPYRRESFLDTVQAVVKTTRRVFLGFDISCDNELYFSGSAAECVIFAKKLEKDRNFVCILEGRKKNK